MMKFMYVFKVRNPYFEVLKNFPINIVSSHIWLLARAILWLRAKPFAGLISNPQSQLIYTARFGDLKQKNW